MNKPIKFDFNQETFKTLEDTRKTYRPQDFKIYLENFMSGYIINKEFIERYQDLLNPATVLKNTLTEEALKSYRYFDVEIWKKGIEYKDISILMDDNFCVSNNIEPDTILSISRNIPDNVFEKYFNITTDKAKRNMLLRYRGKHANKDLYMSNFYLLKEDLFILPYVRENILSSAMEIKLFLDGVSSIDILSLVSLLSMHPCHSFMSEEFMMSLNIITVSDTPEEEQDYTRYKVMLTKIIEADYDSNAISLLFEEIGARTPWILGDKVLLSLIALNDNIKEDTLITLSKQFLIQGLKPEFVNYCKRHRYVSALLAIGL